MLNRAPSTPDAEQDLYERDFYAWAMAQAAALRYAAAAAGNIGVDWLNVAEEIESMGRSERKAVHGALRRIIEHLLKLEYSPAGDPRAGWRLSAMEHRIRVLDDLKASPSLWSRIDLDGIYTDARDLALEGVKGDGLRLPDLPDTCLYTLDQILDRGWWPASRNGIED
jgi:hypothetical protein